MREVGPLLHDDALPASQFRRLARGVKALGTERLRTTYQTTFWFELSDLPSCLPEAAALQLRALLPTTPRRRVVGVEWWLSRMWTRDVPRGLSPGPRREPCLRTGALMHPRWSSVFFLNRVRGGPLAVTRRRCPNEANPSCAPDLVDLIWWRRSRTASPCSTGS